MTYPIYTNALNDNYEATTGMVFDVKEFGASGDGFSDDWGAIQKIINHAVDAKGGTLYFPAGVYMLSRDIVIPLSDMSIRGCGTSSILRMLPKASSNVITVKGLNRISISDIQIDGNKANVAQIAIQYTKLSGIWLQNCNGVTIKNCYIHDSYVSGIMANGGCSNLIISNNRLENNFDNQIYIRAQDQSPYTPCTYGTINANECNNGSFSGIQVLGSSYFAITGNTCHGNGPTQGQGDGIGSEGASHITISGNTCSNNGVQGIQTRYTSETGTNQVSSHIAITGNEVYGNVSPNGDSGGIGINDTDDVVVAGNIVYGNGIGINVNNGTGLGVNHCQIIGNSVRANSGSGSISGISINPGTGTDFICQDNYSTDNAGDNLYATARVIIQGGVYARAAANKEGLHLSTGSDNSVVDGAMIYDNGDNGIEIDGNAAGIEIRNCLFNNYTTTAQARALQEQAGAGPTRMVNCRILNQHNNPYTFNNAASGFFDEQTKNTVTVTTNYTVTANDAIILCNQAGAITITLPSVTNAFGKHLTIKDKSGTGATNTITVSGANNIDGAANKVINTAYGALRLVCDGFNWFTI